MSQMTCPICGRRLTGNYSEWPQLPFCSPRCKTIDLGRWLSESYSIPAEEPPDEESELDESENS